MFAPWKKVMFNLDSILKSRDITLPTKVHLVKAMVFPVVMYGCENWTIKKPEHRRIDAFELWCWRRLLRVPWTARRSNQSILKDAGSRWGIPLVTKVMRKEARHTQRRDRASGVPLDILEHIPPKNQSLPTLLLCALTSDFTGGCPPPPPPSLCQRVNLQLQLIKFLGN